MLKKTLTRDIKLKDGRLYAEGMVMTLSFTNEIVWVTPNSGTMFRIPARRISEYFNIKKPSMATLERWNEAGTCKTITGHVVEPDGHGPDGSPSWLLALGMV